MDDRYSHIIDILHREVKPALGCTEPIAVALAVAKAVEIISDNCPCTCPEGWRKKANFKIDVSVSANILKNGMGVGIPGTGMVGLPIAAALGAVCGDSSKGLEVLSAVSGEAVARAKELVSGGNLHISVAPVERLLYVKATVSVDGQAEASTELDPHAYAIIEDDHDRIVETSFADKILMCSESGAAAKERDDPAYDLSVKEIYEFALNAPYESISFILEDRTLNLALAREGLSGNYGLSVGKAIRENQKEVFGDDFMSFAMGMTAAASDARMAGCTLPAMSNSGSGNQGITTSVPVIIYAREMGKSHEELLRALCVSNLVTTHLKTGIGRLSAYCGAVSAGCGAGAGVAYLKGGRVDMIAHTVVNAVAVDSGIICDGAKASCAAKIASAVDAGLLGIAMYEDGNQFFGGDGIVKCGVENTIASVGRLARFGMQQTDKEIIQLMMEN